MDGSLFCGHIVFKTLEKGEDLSGKALVSALLYFCDCLFNSLNEKNPVQWILLYTEYTQMISMWIESNNMQNCH